MLGISISTGAAWMVDPHLMVLGVLAAGWALDKLLAALEWLRGPRPDCAAERSGAPGETGGPVDARTDGPTDAQTLGPTDAQTLGPTDARTDGHAGGSRPAGAE